MNFFGNDPYAQTVMAVSDRFSAIDAAYNSGDGFEAGRISGSLATETALAATGLGGLARSGINSVASLSVARGRAVAPSSARDQLIAANRARAQYLKARHGHLSQDQRLSRIDDLSSANYNRVLAHDLADTDFVYRAIPADLVDIYRMQGGISGRGGSPTYFSIERGLTPADHAGRTQLNGQSDILLRIPTSELRNTSVPRPFGYELNTPSFGREYFVNSYPQYGSGGFRQFTGSTSTFSEDWIVGW